MCLAGIWRAWRLRDFFSCRCVCLGRGLGSSVPTRTPKCLAQLTVMERRCWSLLEEIQCGAIIEKVFTPPPPLIYSTNLLLHRKQSVMCQEKPFLWPGWWRSAELRIEHLQTVDIKKIGTRRSGFGRSWKHLTAKTHMVICVLNKISYP